MSADKLTVSVPRAWLENILISTRGELPRGRLGDAVFILRGQIVDLLAKHEGVAESASPHDVQTATKGD